ncbi:MAG TPA: alpha/beta fold hydrolase [Usitatibacter sp.]|nr:alpha/beta fold hydrolase [Usitatibacter sp.]
MLARQMRRAQLVELALYVAVAAWLRSRGWGLAAAALAVPALALGIRLAIVCGLYALAWPRERLSPGAWAAMLLREYRALVAMNLLYTPWEASFVRPDPADDAPGGLAVVLVHGYFVNRGCWKPLLPHLEAARIGPVFVPNCRSHLAPIERFEEDLHAAIERASGGGARRVALVAHSMGGLAARLYLARRGGSRVAKLITLGSPHHGTRIARWGIGPNARQMEPGSAFLEALEAAEAGRPGPPTLSIGSTHDDMIAPQASSPLEWARNVALRGCGHVSLLGAGKVAQLVVEELQGAR